jgi:hypothetical protein
VFAPNNDSAAIRMNRAQFFDAVSIKTHPDLDRTK